MRRFGFIALPGILIALVIGLGSPWVGAAQDKKSGGPRSDQTRGQVKEKGKGSHAEWFADPVRGWVRSNEGHESRGQWRGPTDNPKTRKVEKNKQKKG
jgi:hypothetical protein